MRNNMSVLNIMKRKAGVETLVFMTDRTRAPNPDEICLALPRGSIVILRDYDFSGRKALAVTLKKICKKQGLLLLIAGDFDLATKVRADGVHLPEHMLFEYRTCRQLKKFSLITAACHNRKSLHRAIIIGVDAAIVSPVFKTNSHVGIAGIGVHVFSRLINRCGLPVVALGGISFQNVGQLKRLDIVAIAGIDGIAEQAL